jgi:hypothetical protein
VKSEYNRAIAPNAAGGWPADDGNARGLANVYVVEYNLYQPYFQEERMNSPSTRARVRLLGLGVALLLLALTVAACVPAGLPSPAATSAPPQATEQPAAATSVPVATTPAQTEAPAAPAATQPAAVEPAAGQADLPAGVDADGNFYRGDPKAPVKLVEFSDFQ